MKKIITIAIALCCTLQLQLASAQSAELKQLALNIEKLAQLKQVLQNMKKGYEVVTNGYNRIKDLSQGNFNLHDAFLNGLLLVNPQVAKYRRVADIISIEQQLISEYKSAYGRFRSGGQFNSVEIEYLGRVYGNLFDRSVQQLDELTMIITSGQLRMSDDERIEGINRIYDDMQEKITFLRGFNRRTAAVEAQRKMQRRDLGTYRDLNGLK